MSALIYRTSLTACRFVDFQCIRRQVLHPERADRAGPYVLAATHLSHLEPVLVSLSVPRGVRWMSRIEFYKYRWSRWVLEAHGTFPVNRSGVPVSTIRRAVSLLDAGEVVGIFPEGGVVHGPAAAIRGGPIKGGACVIARRAGVPIVPVVVLGADKLNRLSPWLPARRGRVWMAFGQPLTSDPALPPRQARHEMSGRLSAAMVSLYAELLAAFGLSDAQIP
ncbi:MAG TPA: lysophospholipid acyltransferase family protein [Tepidisphaeraceae bacterium]|jgi:1-acyl-sn-glycerol-3-phosphate acyltransferase